MHLTTAFEKYLHDLQALYPIDEAKEIMYLVFEDCLLVKRSHLKLINKELDTIETYKLNQVMKRLLQAEPLQYVLGYAYFFDMALEVNPSVLIPRPETEDLVNWVVEDLGQKEELKVLDIGTGSGCIAIALAKKLKSAHVVGLDVSAAAIATATKNAHQHQASVDFKIGSLFDPSIQDWIKAEAFDIIVSNPPYIPEHEKASMHENVLRYEPASALFVPDEDPLLFYRTITNPSLSLGSSSYFEISAHAEPALHEMCLNLNRPHWFRRDMANLPRFLKVEP